MPSEFPASTGPHSPLSNRPLGESAAEARLVTKANIGSDGGGENPIANGAEVIAGVERSELAAAAITWTLPPLDDLPDIGSASFRRAPSVAEIVHGPDDRVEVKTTTVFPWRATASLLITARDGSRWIGTAWFISPTTLATAGHCVCIKHSGVEGRDGWVRSIQVMPARSGQTLPFGAITATRFWSVKGWVDDGQESYDYGAIEIAADVGRRTGWFGIGVVDDAELSTLVANIAGYPGDKASGTLWFDARKVASVEPDTVHYDVDTAGGQSGAAVYGMLPEGRVAIGIHNYGGAATNSATRISPPVFANLYNWSGTGGELARSVVGAEEPRSDSPITSKLRELVQALRTHGAALVERAGALGVRPGVVTENGALTTDLAVVIVRHPSQRGTSELSATVPHELEGFPIEFRDASPDEQLTGVKPLAVWESLLTGVRAEAAFESPYRPPTDATLNETTIARVTCHIGPDSGWSTLQPFLEGTRKKLSVSMFDFYAQHIIATMEHLGSREERAKLKLVLQVEPSKESATIERLRESWDDRLDFWPASVKGSNRLFKNSYHTKVAVRDGKELWLSSGNWSPNSQPEVPDESRLTAYRLGNREWHVVVHDQALAQTFERFVEWDLAEAKRVAAEESTEVMPDLLVPASELAEPEAVVQQPRSFTGKTFGSPNAKIRVQPVMTPDNYARVVLSLIDSVEDALWMQFSYIRPATANDAHRALIEAVTRQIEAGRDVRIIVDSRNQKVEDTEALLALGWTPKVLRYQRSKVHNKGIIVDGQAVLVCSANWSPDGTQFNRDAGIIFYSTEIAQYYADVFTFDWKNLTRPPSITESAPVLAGDGVTPPGMVRVPWSDWFSE